MTSPARPDLSGGGSRNQLRRYAEAVALWTARYDTFEIAERLSLPEYVIAKWVANFRDQARAET